MIVEWAPESGEATRAGGRVSGSGCLEALNCGGSRVVVPVLGRTGLGDPYSIGRPSFSTRRE
jgi:hypothetical protein